MSKNAIRHQKQHKTAQIAKDGEVTRLRKVIKRLQGEKQKLISQISTLTHAFDKNVKFLKGVTRDFTVNELISSAKKELCLKNIMLEKETLPSLEEKWKCHTCNVGVMKLLIFTVKDTTSYFRKCSNQKCTNRTKPQTYTDDVEGVK